MTSLVTDAFRLFLDPSVIPPDYIVTSGGPTEEDRVWINSYGHLADKKIDAIGAVCR